MTGNYFCLRHRVTNNLVGLFAFDPHDLRDTQLAYRKASSLALATPGCEVSVFAIPRYAGEWDRLPLAKPVRS